MTEKKISLSCGFCGSQIWEGLGCVILARGLSYGCNQMAVETRTVEGEGLGRLEVGQASLSHYVWSFCMGQFVLPHSMVASGQSIHLCGGSVLQCSVPTHKVEAASLSMTASEAMQCYFLDILLVTNKAKAQPDSEEKELASVI